MSDAPLHRMYFHFSELPLSLRVLYTAALLLFGMGYLFALTLIFITYAPKDGNPNSLSYEDIVIGYSGSGQASRLESALRGPMRTMLPSDELNTIVAWVQAGAKRPDYDAKIRPIVEQRCLSCHDGSNPHIPNFTRFDELQKLSERDTGPAIATLVRVSHIHLFGLGFIFFIVGTIFSHAYVRPIWLKALVIATPFVCIALDVTAWYVTKIFHPFALVVMAGGAAYGAAFAFMWIVSMYQMWFAKAPSKVLERSRNVG